MVGTYTDIYRAKELAERVNLFKQGLGSDAIAKIKADARSKLQEQLNSAEAKLQNLLDNVFHVDSLAALNKRIKNYHQATLNFNGPELEEAVLKAYKQALGFGLDSYFEKEVEYIIRKRVIPEIEKTLVDKAITPDLIKEGVLKFMNNGKITSGKSFTSTDFLQFTPEGIFQGIDETLFNKSNRREWNDIINYEIQKAHPRSKKRDDLFKIDVEKSYKANHSSEPSAQLQAQIGFQWASLSKDIKSLKELYDLYGEENVKTQIDQKLAALNSYLVEEIPKLASSDQNLIKAIVQYVVEQKGRNFYDSLFMGKNVKGVTGILGEIQGIYYICKLLIDDDKSPGITDIEQALGSVQWTAQTLVDNKQSHQDILVKGFGVQVKNTAKDVMSRINFDKGEIDSLLNDTGLSKEIQDLLKSYFATKVFNVPYTRENFTDKVGRTYKYRGAYKAAGLSNTLPFGDVDVYVSSYRDLQNLQDQVDKLLSFAASVFMYLDIGENSVDQANTLFLLGGSILVSVVDILQALINSLDSEDTPMKIRGSVKIENTHFNIITAYNLRLGKRGRSKFEEDNYKKMKSSYYTEGPGRFGREGQWDWGSAMVDNLMLTSSFDFTDIINKAMQAANGG